MAKRKQGVVVKGGGCKSSSPKSGTQPDNSPSAADSPAASSPTAASPDADCPSPASNFGIPDQTLSIPAAGGSSRKKKRRINKGETAATTTEVVKEPIPDDAPPVVTIEEAWTAKVPGPAFDWLYWPMTPSNFFEKYWERKPLHLKRQNPEYHGKVFSKAALDCHLAGGTLLGYGNRLNMSKVDETGKKVPLNPAKRGVSAKAADVQKAWQSGASLQVMHPQQFHEPVWKLLQGLERNFGALFGANAYLTPAGTQGFAPHFDDVEVFMLQMEGSKRWRIYEPPAGEEFPLPREYSRDFLESELGEPVLDCVLEAGDMLYLPRGFVHQGVAESGSPVGYSHHLTVSTYQKTSWCQVFERALSGAVERAAESSQEFREGLPVGFLRYMGSFHDATDASPSKSSTDEKAAFVRKFHGLMKRLQEFVDLDEVCDELGVEFMSQRLPPCVERDGTSSTENEENPAPSITQDSLVQWVDPSAIRAMISTDPETSEPTVMVFHSFDNDREGHMKGNADVEAEEDVGCLRYEASTFLPSIRKLIDMPTEGSVRCGDLKLKDEDDRVALCTNLMEAGLLKLVDTAKQTTIAAKN